MRILVNLGPLLSALAVVVGALLLRRVLVSIEKGRPFDPHNARRLAAVAGLVVLDGTGATLLRWVGARAALTSLGRTLDDTALPDSAFGPFGVSSLLVALVVLAFAEAFRRGRHLAEDADGLV